MPRIKTQPIRMCIVCRSRGPQDLLWRFQCKERELHRFTGAGRSLYLCATCLEDKRLERSLARQCKTGETKMLLSQLKEIIADDR